MAGEAGGRKWVGRNISGVAEAKQVGPWAFAFPQSEACVEE